MEVGYELGHISKQTIDSGPRSLWRYREFLPVDDEASIVETGAGFTPLVRADSLGREIGIKNLYIKNDTLNPTFSFKDRPASVAVSKAKEFKLSSICCASTGNLASATAAIAAKANLPCYVLMPKDVEQPKIIQAAQYDAQIVLVDGTYDNVNRLAHLIGEKFGIGVVNVNLRPYYVEGSKTVAFEIAEQLGWRLPDHIIVPVASGALMCSIRKGFTEFAKAGLVEEHGTRVTGAQPGGCSPVATAFKEGRDAPVPVEFPRTIVKSLAIGSPSDGEEALRVARQTGGSIESLSDEEISESVKLLARTEGIFAEPGGVIAVAALRKLVREGSIGLDEEVVCAVTAAGFKSMAETQVWGKTVTIPPKLEAFTDIFRRG